MKINRDYFNNLEKPTFILRKASGDRINTIPVIEATYDEKYMDIDEANITVPLYIDNVLNPIYEQIEVMKYVEITNVGIFCIASVEVQSEGTDIERKNVNLKSLEWLLGQKYLEEFTINMGTVGSEDDIDLTQLMSKVLMEKFPDWGVDYIDPELASKQRSFDVSRQDIYSFLNEDIAQAFEATMSFNTFTKKVSVYKAEHFEEDTNIHISYNNLLKNTSLSSSTDEIKTALTVTGDDDLSLREINMGYDTIYNLDYFANEEYMSEELLAAYNAWQALYHSEVDLSKFEFKDGVITRAELQGKTYEDAYNLVLLPKYQAYYDEIAKWTSGYVPLAPTTKTIGYGSFPDPNNPETIITIQSPTKYEVYYNNRPSTGSEDTLYIDAHSLTAMYRWVAGRGWFDVNNWSSNKEGLAFCLNELKSQLTSANNMHAVNLNNNTYSDAQKKNSTYLPTLYTLNAIDTRIPDVKNPKYPEEEPDKPGILDVLEGNQAIIEKDMKVITDLLDMRNNLTSDQLKELSTFIREDELSAANYVITDTMTTEEKFEMLQDMLQYGRDELAKVSVPQLTFSSELLNLYSMPEFDSYAEDFDIGKYLWVTLRDDFSVKAKLLTIHVNYFDPGDFSVTFGNVIRNGKNIFTDIQDAINAATSAATSVTFNASNWNEASKESNEIYTSMSQGLLSQSQYLGAPDKNKVLIDENGLWVTTSTGDHGKETTDEYDSIYLGGGRILLTSDGWKTVRMSMGRTNLNIHRFADTNKSRIEEVRNYSAFGTIADFVMAGTVEGSTIVGGDVVSTNYNKTSTPPKGTRLDLSNGAMYMYGSGGSMVFDGTNLNVKGTINATAGDFGADGTNKVKIGTTGQDSYIYSGSHSSYNNTSNGFYLGNNGLSLGGNFSVSKEGTLNANNANISGYIKATTGQIGNWNISKGSLTNGTVSLQGDGSIVCTVGGQIRWSINYEGVANFTNGTFSGKIIASSGEIGGCHITGERIYAADIAGNEMWSINKDGQATFKNVYINGVQNGSDFAGLSYDGTNLNLGRLLTCANDFSPFGGGCVTQISSLSVGAFQATYMKAGYIISDYIKSSEVCADYVKTTAITSPAGEHLNIYANKLYTNSIQIGAHSYSTPVAIVVNNQHYTVLGHPGT